MKGISLKGFYSNFKKPTTKKDYFEEYFSRLKSEELKENPELTPAIKYEKTFNLRGLRENQDSYKMDTKKIRDLKTLNLVNELNELKDNYNDYCKDERENISTFKNESKMSNIFKDKFQKIQKKNIFLHKDDINLGEIKEEYRKRDRKVPKLNSFNSNLFKPSLLLMEKSEIERYFYFKEKSSDMENEDKQIDYLEKLNGQIKDKINEQSKEIKSSLRIMKERKALREKYYKDFIRVRNKELKKEEQLLREIERSESSIENLTLLDKFFKDEDDKYYQQKSKENSKEKNSRSTKKPQTLFISPNSPANIERNDKPKFTLSPNPLKSFNRSFSMRNFDDYDKRYKLELSDVSDESSVNNQPPETPVKNVESSFKKTGENFKSAIKKRNPLPSIKVNNSISPNNEKEKKMVMFKCASTPSLEVMYKDAVIYQEGKETLNKQIQSYFKDKEKKIKINLTPKATVVSLINEKGKLFKKDFLAQEGHLIRMTNGSYELSKNEIKYANMDDKLLKSLSNFEMKLARLAYETQETKNLNARKLPKISSLT